MQDRAENTFDGSQKKIDEENGDEHDHFEIAEFLENYRGFFTVMSIFGAISIYLLQLHQDQPNSRILRVGVSSAVFLFLLSCYALVKEANAQYRISENFFEYFFIAKVRNYELIVFSTAFFALVISIVGIGTNYTASFGFLFQVIAFPIGISVAVFILDNSTFMLPEEDGISDLSFKDSMMTLLLDMIGMLVLAIILGYSVNYLENSYNAPPDVIFTFTTTNNVPAIAYSLISGATLMTLFIFVALILAALSEIGDELRKQISNIYTNYVQE